MDYTKEVSEEIRELIMQTESPRDKAELLILLRISENLNRNTELTESLANQVKSHIDAFERHEKTEMALINQGRGFIRAALVALALFQGAMAVVGSRVLSDYDNTKVQVSELQKQNIAITSKLDMLKQ